MFPLMILVCGAGGPEPAFVVQNRCPPVVVVTNRIPAKPSCVCGTSCSCAPGKCPSSCPVATQPAPVVIHQAVAAPADLHSHTCSRGHTWSHSSSDPRASHNCPVCGLYQNVVDQGRPVVVQQATSSYTLSPFAAPGGCVGGNCPAPQRVYYRR